MECNGKALTEEQVNMLQFMINNYNKKNMDICSCDVERVLGNKGLELTKLEIAIAIGAFIQGLGEEVLNNNESKVLKQIEDKLAEILSNSTLNQIQEAGEGVLNKLIQSLFEENDQEPKEPIPPYKK